MSAVANPESKEEEMQLDDQQNEQETKFTTKAPVHEVIKMKKKKNKKKKKKKQNANLPPGYARVQKELQQLLLNPPDGISACPVSKDDLLQWIATIQGPENTPYHGGKFYLNIKFGENYPFEPPKVTFKTKIYHCNIRSSNGEICLDVLKDNYSPALTVEKILLSLCALLQSPNPEDPLVGDVANELISNQAKHDETAREWTKRYAMIKQ
eukprot:CAMPEP_0197039090 /NCGR_PEP_ID=MMETSP1384-20130603/15944_1 /TAXON_ID=29189 /ORGANISM="Ammonia sp." /LENGTH=209 /DNA_ID=CAMNT_0042469633 /DNA_START=109 /DNA_END=738 /DNA_ORIENTATION=-